MTCESELRKLLKPYVEEKLSEQQKAEVEAHLRTCEPCKRECLGLMQVALDAALTNMEAEIEAEEPPEWELTFEEFEREALGEEIKPMPQRLQRIVHAEHLLRRVIEESAEYFIQYLSNEVEIAIFPRIKELFFRLVPAPMPMGPALAGVGLVGGGAGEGKLSASALAATTVLVEGLIRERIAELPEEIDEKCIPDLLDYLEQNKSEIKKTARRVFSRKHAREYTEQFLKWFREKLNREGVSFLQDIKAGTFKEEESE
jgi:anti-sigma factor RsiW